MISAATKYRLPAVSVFGIAMGFLEAAIVVYLRRLYFPGGFGFPLTIPGDTLVLFAELIREVATVVMLLALAWLAGSNYLQRFGWFLFSFAVWDIFYYVGLEVFLGWPPSWLTWDVLYLIPVTWVGPVLAPVICSLLMVVLAFAFFATDHHDLDVKAFDWVLIYSGAFVIFLTFIWDFSVLIINNGLWRAFFSLPESEQYISLIGQYVPQYFNWPMFGAGVIVIAIAISRLWIRLRISGK